MKAKKRISKKLLSLLLSLLMVVTTIPLVVIPATAATTGTVNPSNWQAVCGTNNSARADGTRVVVTSDGEAGNSSVGLIKFSISSVPDGVTSATLNVQATNHGGRLANSTVQVHSVDPSKFNASVTKGVVVNPSAFGSTYNSNTMATNVYSYFGCSSSTSLGTITQSDPRTYNFDITRAMNAAKSAGQTELCLLFMMPQCYNDNNGDTWSDVNIIIAGTNIAYSYDTSVPTVPTGIFPASVVENTNKTTLSFAQARNTAVTTIHGNFANDDSYMTDDHYNQIYKNVLYSPTKSASGSDSDYAVLLNAQCYWNNYYARWFHAETVMMYDGETTPSTGIMMFYASSKNAWNGGGHTHLLCSYIPEGTGDGLVLQENWHAADSGRNSDNTVRLNMQYTWFGKPATVNNFKYTQTSGNYTGYFDNNGKENCLANIIKYTGSMADTEWSKTIYPKYGFFAKNYDQANNTSGVKEDTSRVPFHIINYKPLKAAINKANNLIAAVNANPSKYDPTWVRSLVVASNALIAAKPNNFVNASKNDVAGYASAAKAAVEQFNAVEKPYTDSNDLSELATYTVTFKNGYTGDTISSANYKYGQTPTAPSFQLTKRTYAGTPQHSSNYEWSSVISAVTDNTDYTQNVTSWENCDFSIKDTIKGANCHETGSEKQTCSVCGTEKTVPIAINPNNHVGAEELRDVKAATCTEKGYTGDLYCLGCGNVKTSGSATDALGHDWGEWETIVEPQWNAAGSEKRTCKRDGTHTETRDIPATGDLDFPTATATVVIDNQDRSNDTFSTDPVKYYPSGNLAVPVKITASDATSGIKEVRYYISDSILTLDQAKTQNYNRTLTLDSNGFAKLPNDLASSTDRNFIVYFKIVDNADNVTYVNTSMVVFDVTDPTIALTGNGKADESEFCLTVNVKVEDTNLKTVTINGAEQTVENGRFTADLTAGTYTVVATDMTGNSITKTFTVNASHTGGTATCQNHATCAVCGQGYGEKDPDNHVNLTHHEGQAATCTEDGWTEYDECVCGAIIGKTPITAPGHTNKYVSNNDGTHNVVCDVCGDTIETNVACSGDETGGHKAATCTEPAKREHECANCHYKYWVNEEGSVPTGHKYNDTAVFNWTSSDVDGVKVWTCDTATFTCAVDGCGHTEEVAVTPTHVTTDAKCGVAGSVVYTATATLNYTFMGVSVPATATEKQEVTLPALEHVWGDVSFVWATAEDGTVSCTASRTCANGHTDPLDVKLTHEQTTVPTCTIKEVVTYTAEVTVDGAKKTDTYEVEGAVDSTNHSYVDAVTPPTCTTDGYTTHTCSACGDTYTDSKVDMLGHDWDNPVFTWADDNTCTAIRTCKRAGCGTTEPVDVVVTHATTTPATCTEKEVVTYTATATIGDKNYTSTKDVIGEIDPNNHDWVLTGKTPATCEDNEVEHYECSKCQKTKNVEVPDTAIHHDWDNNNATFTWTKTEDGKSFTATATRKCLNDEKHTETVDAVISEPVIDPDATCETPGTATFTATATFSDKTTAIGTKTEPVSALGHDYGTAVIEWSADHTSVTATKTCSRDGDHKLVATANATVEITATCENAGEKIYTAELSFNDGSKQTAVYREDVGALGHDWDEPTFNWTADKDSATLTATFVCNTDKSHTKTVTVDADKINRTEEAATCEADGKVTYTVEGFTFEGKAYDVPAKEVKLDKLGHAYGEYTIADADRPTKNEDGTWTNGTLRAVCANGCGIEATKTIGRADYTKYDKAWNDLVTLRDRDDVNAEVKAEIQDVLDANVIAQNLVALENEQKTIDDATARLVYELEEAEKKISYTVTFVDEDGNVVYTELVLKGEDVKNVPAVPEKAPDKDNHYNGKWNGATTNIQFNETVHAVYTAEAHRGGTATCVSGKKCEVCGTVYTDASQDGHDWELHFFWAQDYSKCEAKVVCKNCGFETVEVLDAKVTKVENPATCTAEGSITYTATVSYQGETRTSVRTETLKPTGHKYGKVEFHWDADHNCKAWKTCASCGNRLMADNVDVVYSKVERTCEIEGFDVYTATATFGTETFENVKKISLGFAEHQFGETYLIKESTCTEQGLEGRKCSVCGAVTAKKLPLKEHQPKTIPGYAATCTKAGLTDGIICAECSYAIKAQEIIPALGHIDENNDGVCDRCGTYLGVKPPVEPENDGCICHREGNIFGKIIRIICTVLSGVFHKDIKCCPDMEWWSTKKG